MEVGQTVSGKYLLERRLGRGGMGEVWAASDPGLGREVAIKIVLADLSGDETLMQRLRAEARTAAGLNHPGITVVHDIGEHEGHPYFVMEFLEGRDFTQLLTDYQGGMPVARAVGLMSKVAEALAYAHTRGVVHRDIKPANLMELGDGSVRICDFGIAKYSDATAQLTATGGLLGTPAFMAPELYEGRPAAPASDLYAFGCTLHSLLAGEPPFSAPSLASLMRQHLVSPPPRLPASRGDVPAEMDGLIQALLAKDPQQRPTGPEVVTALQEVLSPNLSHTRRAASWQRQPTMPAQPGMQGQQGMQGPQPGMQAQPGMHQQSYPSLPPQQMQHPSFPSTPPGMAAPGPAAAPYSQYGSYPGQVPMPVPVPMAVAVPVSYGGQNWPGYDPITGQPLSDKSKLTAGLLQIFLGGLGVGRFYTGHVGMAIGQIAVTWLTCGFGWLWPLIDGIVLLANGGTDSLGRKLR